MLFGHIHLYLCCFQPSKISWFLKQELSWLAFSNSVSFRVNLLLSMCISKILSHLIQSFMKMNLELNFPPGLLSHVSIIFLYAFSTQSWNHFGHHGKWNMYLVTKILTVLLFTGWCNYFGCWLPCLLQLIALFSCWTLSINLFYWIYPQGKIISKDVLWYIRKDFVFMESSTQVCHR